MSVHVCVKDFNKVLVVVAESHDWLGCWGHHMKSPGFKAIREYQKVGWEQGWKLTAATR